MAARLEQAARPGEVLIGGETFGLVRDAVHVEPVDPLPLKGKAEAVRAFRLLEVTPGMPGHVRRLDTPLVGRGQELSLLRDAFARAERERACHLFTVLGTAGVGKSRLVGEFLAGLPAGVIVAQGRCLPYGEGITYWPVLEAVREGVGLAEGDGAETSRKKLAALLGDEPNLEAIVQRVLEALALAEGSASSEESLWALRKLFEALARESPLVLVLDDIQWGEATFLDLIEHLADWSRDAPILLLCMARPDVLDVRPGWGGGKLNATTVLLEPLDQTESDSLIGSLLGEAELDAAAKARIAAAAEGNPLFLEEMVGMLIDDGLLRRENGRWAATADLTIVPIPPTIRALLAARLDRLAADERLVIERAAVEGQVFHRGAVAALAPESARPSVPSCLLGLVRRELIRPDRPTFAGDDAFRFRHLLIRDAAYEALPKEARAQLHERFAEWLEGKPGDYPEIVGYHLEQAWRYRTEISPREEHGALAARAGDRLGRAGRRAFTRGDMPAATNLFARAVALLPPRDEERIELLPLLASALSQRGALADARAVLAEAIELARESGNRRVEWRARAAEGWWRQNMDPEQSLEETEQLARRAIEVLDVLGDDFGLAHAWRLLSDVHNARGDGAGWVESLERGFEHARRAGNRHEEWACLAILGGAMFFGPTPAGEAVARLEELRSRIGDDHYLESALGRALGGFLALQGRVEEGRALIERSRSILTELGLGWGLAAIPFVSGRIALWTGEAEAAEREYRAAATAYAAMGERGRQSSIVGDLAEAVYVQGRFDDAERLAEEAVALAHENDFQPQVQWRCIRAKVLAQRGEFDEAKRLAYQAVEIADASDYLDQRAIAQLDLAEVLELGGRPADAIPAVENALALARQKENVLLARRTTQRLERLRAAT